MKDKDKALNLQKLNDDNPRLTAKIVMKKTKYASQNLHTEMYSDDHKICRSIWNRF